MWARDTVCHATIFCFEQLLRHSIAFLSIGFCGNYFTTNAHFPLFNLEFIIPLFRVKIILIFHECTKWNFYVCLCWTNFRIFIVNFLRLKLNEAGLLTCWCITLRQQKPRRLDLRQWQPTMFISVIFDNVVNKL